MSASSDIHSLQAALVRAETQARRLNALNRVAQAVSSTRDLNEILEIAAREIVIQLDAHSCGVTLVNAARTHLDVVAFAGREGEPSTVGVVIPLEGNPGSQQVIATRQSLVVADAQNSPLQNEVAREIFRSRGITCLLITPMVVRDEVIGTFGVDIDEVGRVFTAEEVELAVTIAGQVSGAIENARLYAETQQRYKETEILRAANVALTQSLDLDTILGTLLDYLQQIVPYDSGSVFVLEGECCLMARAARGYERWVEEPSRAVGVRFDFWDIPHIRRVIEDQVTVVIPDVKENPHWVVAETAVHVRNWLAVPLAVGGKTIGMYSLDKVQPGYFTVEHQRLAENLAAQAAIALQNATLYRDQQVAREQAETLRSAAQALGSTLSLQDVFRLILSELRKVVPYDSCSVQQLDGNMMVIVGGHGFPNLDELLGARFDFSGPDDPAGEVVRVRHPVIIADVSARFKHFRDETHGKGRVHGWMGVPLMFGERLTGMLTLDKLEENFYTPDHAQLAQAFATQAATAIENARLFDETQRLLKITEHRANELAIINSVQEELSSKLFTHSLYERIGDRLRDIFDAQVVDIGLYDPQDCLIHFPYTIERGVRYPDEPIGLIGYRKHVMETREPLLIHQDSAEMSERFGNPLVIVGEEPKSDLFVPLVVGDKAIGVISLQNLDKEFAFSESDVSLLTTLANAMSVAIENARLFDETQRLLKITEERAAELSAISKVSQALIVESELDSTIQLIGNQIQEIFNADIVYVALLDPRTHLIHFPYQVGENFTTLKLGEGLTSKIIATGEPILINQDVDVRSREIGASPVGREVLSYLGVPIKTSQGTIGVISVQSTLQEGAFNDDSIRLLTTIAANAGAALHNARLFSEALENLRQVEILTNAAKAIENSAYEPAMVESVAARTDALGELARVFRKMADEVRLREQRLKRQLAQLQLDIEENQQAKAETVAIYIPMDRRQAMARQKTLPEYVQGAALFADISGFTALTESLANELGLQRGAEEMIRHLNRVFTTLIDEIHRFGGAVISFSGDAITCWFDECDPDGNCRAERAVERAAACAFAMQEGMLRYTAITTPDGKTIALSIKVALAAGPARRMVVGEGTPHQIDVLAGATLSVLADAEHEAERGEIVLAAADVPMLEQTYHLAGWRQEKRFAVLAGLKKEIAPCPWPDLDFNAIAETQIKPWMHAAVFEKVRTGQSDMLSELRPATALFLKFGGLDYDQDPGAAEKLNAFMQWVERVIALHHGSIIQFTVGDKGSYIYIVFGAPVAHRDDAVQAVFTALELAARPEELSYMTTLSIGLASGQMRVGAYGGASHRTYGAIGDRTNLAARLMVAASRSSAEFLDGQHAIIYCNESVYTAARTRVEFETMPSISVKGKSEPIPVFRPLRKLEEIDDDSGVALERAQLIDRLSPAEQLTLKVASVIGQLFTLEALSAIYPEIHEREQLQAYLETLFEAGLVYKRSPDSTTYHFKDLQTHETAYNLMLFAQRRQLHRAMAELLEQTIFSTPPYAQIAHHWKAADEITKAVQYLEKAGEHARAMGDYEEATRFFNESLRLNS